MARTPVFSVLILGGLLTLTCGADDSHRGSRVRPERQPTQPLPSKRLDTADEAALVKQAQELGEKGMKLSDSGRRADAIAIYRQALDVMAKVGGPEGRLPTVLRMMLAEDLTAQGQYVEAETLYRRALAKLLEVYGENHADTARCYVNLANNLNEQGKVDEAESLTRKVLGIMQRIHGEHHHNTAVAYNNLTLYLHHAGKYSEAVTSGQKALAIFEKLHGRKHLQVAQALDNIAVNLSSQWRKAEAEVLIRQALAIFVEVVGERDRETAICYENLGVVLREQGNLPEAAFCFQKALTLYRELLPKQHVLTARSLRNLADTQLAQGKLGDAQKHAEEALAMCQALFQDKHLDTAECHMTVAKCVAARGKLVDAYDHSMAAGRIRTALLGADHPTVAHSVETLANFCIKVGDFEKALGYLNDATSSLAKSYGEDHVETGMTRMTRAAALYCLGRYVEAEREGMAAATSVEKARLAMGFSGLERTRFTYLYSPLEFLAGVQARNGKPNDAWSTYEKHLGRGLSDDLAARTSRPLSRAERELEEELSFQLAQLDKQIPLVVQGKGKDPAKAASLRAQRDKVLTQWSELQDSLVKKYGVAAGETYTLMRVQAQLSPDTALIGWLDKSSHSKAKNPHGEHWVCVVRHEGPPVWDNLADAQGGWSQEDDDLAVEIREHLSDPREPKLVPWKKLLARLAKQRLEPVTKHLSGIKRLVVLPSTALAGIPLETLTDKYEVSYAPSATIYAWLRERQRPAEVGGAILALGDPVFSAEQAAKAGKDDALAVALRHLVPKPLPGTRREVEAIVNLFQGQGRKAAKLLGLQANAANLEQLALSKSIGQFRYIHLATHGKPDADGGMNSHLLLTSDNFATAPYAKLTAGHIARTWKLNAELVTLSACETGLGEHKDGEGYIGFSQALFLAGAHSLVLSEWAASDQATALLMIRFYQNLLGQREHLTQPLPRLAALTEAKTWLRTLPRQDAERLLKEMLGQEMIVRLPQGDQPFGHPFYWAPFILIGDPGVAALATPENGREPRQRR